MIQHSVRTVENVRLAERTYRLRIEDPRIAAEIRPGQFVMLRIPGVNDPLLGRPFALYDTYLDNSHRAAGYDIVYLVVGKMTTFMSRLKPGDPIETWGPLGNGFSLEATGHLMMLAGGIGQTPFPAVARSYLGLRRYGGTHQRGSTSKVQPACDTDHCHADSTSRRRADRVTLCYGVRSAAYLAGVQDFTAIGIEVRVATDDGTAGHRGFVTDLVRSALDTADPPTRILGCGPEPMMHTLAEIAAAACVPCELSLESPMACGIGACFSCVAKVRQDDGQWDYRRICVEGPVFDATRILL